MGPKLLQSSGAGCEVSTVSREKEGLTACAANCRDCEVATTAGLTMFCRPEKAYKVPKCSMAEARRCRNPRDSDNCMGSEWTPRPRRAPKHWLGSLSWSGKLKRNMLAVPRVLSRRAVEPTRARREKQKKATARWRRHRGACGRSGSKRCERSPSWNRRTTCKKIRRTTRPCNSSACCGAARLGGGVGWPRGLQPRSGASLSATWWA